MFLLTERCNARCLHCDIWKNKGGEDTPGLEGWTKVLRDLRTWTGPIPLVFTGGEALLRPFTVDLAKEAVQLEFPLEVLTHGYWIDQSRVEKLALTNPWRITMSLDGVGETHSRIRGRNDFWERSNQTVETLLRLREEHKLTFTMRFKTVIMEHNLADLEALARFATRPGVEVFYQPIEQNYNTAEDPRWFESSANWPRDPEKAVAAVETLIRLKEEGLHIANTRRELDVMIPYFRDPIGMRVVTQAHQAQMRHLACGALTNLQIQGNGDVTICANRPPIGNVMKEPIRTIWTRRPAYWRSGCCLLESPEERVSQRVLTVLEPRTPQRVTGGG